MITEPSLKENEVLAFWVAGEPAAQGSKVVGRTKSGRSYIRESSSKLKPWRKAIRFLADSYMATDRKELYDGPVKLEVRFHLLRPKSHLTSKGALTKSAPEFPIRNDLDKLIRAVNDALTGSVFVDDGQVCAIRAKKLYVARNPSGAWIRVSKYMPEVGYE